MTDLAPLLLHASCVAINGRGVLLVGISGVGKSDVALRLIDGGAVLVADDQTLLHREGHALVATAPPSILGLLEVRHIGLMQLPFLESAPIALYVDLTADAAAVERLPEPEAIFLLDHRVQRLRLPALHTSTPAKIRAALTYPLVQ